MKKTIFGLAAILLCTLVMASCGGNTGKPSSTASETASAASESVSGEASDKTEESSSVTAADGYRIIVKDSSGNPVEGATVQFCSDTQCFVLNTGSDGTAVFDQPDGNYTVHILKSPAGYAKDEKEYTAPEKRGEMTIVLQAEGSGTEEASGEASDTGEEFDRFVYDEPEYGMKFDTPESFRNEGKTYPIVYFNDIATDPTVRVMTLGYIPVLREDEGAYNEYLSEWIEAYAAEAEPPEPPKPYWNKYVGNIFEVFSVYTIDKGEDIDELKSYLEERKQAKPTLFELIGTEGNTDFYLAQFELSDEQNEEYKTIMGDLYDEYIALRNDKEGFLKAVTIYEPVANAGSDIKVGDTVSFETTDLDGNPVNSADLFKDHKITVINLWATWCGPCKRELPELAEMAKEFEEKGCQLIGICDDASDEEKINTAKELLNKNGCEYLNLTPTADLHSILQTDALPATFYVDSEGRFLAPATIGAHVDEYPKVVDELLAAME